jgi:hypothetical protein
MLEKLSAMPIFMAGISSDGWTDSELHKAFNISGVIDFVNPSSSLRIDSSVKLISCAAKKAIISLLGVLPLIVLSLIPHSGFQSKAAAHSSGTISIIFILLVLEFSLMIT